jgi:hypothetical protein
MKQSVSTIVVSSVASSTSIVDLVSIVYLNDLHETTTLARAKTYSLVAYNSSTSDIQLAPLYLSSIVEYPE